MVIFIYGYEKVAQNYTNKVIIYRTHMLECILHAKVIVSLEKYTQYFLNYYLRW